MSDGAYYELSVTGAQGGGVGFNGAGMFLFQKCVALDRVSGFPVGFNGAGMFPSQKWPGCVRGVGVPRGFNGAGMFLSRKSRGSRPRLSASGGFNGAGMFLSRKLFLVRHVREEVLGLQWGRDVSIPEIWQCRTGRYTPCRFNGTGMFLSRKSGQNDEKAGRARASMGPGCFYPGNSACRLRSTQMARGLW